MLTSNGKVLGEVGIKRGLFQGDSLSLLLLVLVMISLITLLKRENIRFKLGKNLRLLNHLLFMDVLKLYGRCEEELESSIDVVRDTGM